MVSTALLSIIRFPYSARTYGLRMEALPYSDNKDAAFSLFCVSKLFIRR
jgi:hypothetical protein